MDLAIVGAGAAGAAAAYALRDAPVDVTLFEADEGEGGRAASGRKNECRYDYGANYLKADSPRVAELVTEALPTAGLVDVAEPVWTFDASGAISPGDDRHAHKWTYEAGMGELPERLLAETDATLELGTRVGRLSHSGGTWWLVDDAGADLGTFDAVLLTPPAPRTADVLAATEWDSPLLADLQAAVDAVSYRSIYAAVLHYPFAVDYPWYALVNADREHDIGWLSREELKPGHVPAGETLLVVQMAHGWAVGRNDDPEELTAEVTESVADLLDDPRFAAPDWTDHEPWRDALPNEGVETESLRNAEPAGLYFAGDWVAGDGRVHLAIESGLAAGDRIAGAAGPT